MEVEDGVAGGGGDGVNGLALGGVLRCGELSIPLHQLFPRSERWLREGFGMVLDHWIEEIEGSRWAGHLGFGGAQGATPAGWLVNIHTFPYVHDKRTCDFASPSQISSVFAGSCVSS